MLKFHLYNNAAREAKIFAASVRGYWKQALTALPRATTYHSPISELATCTRKEGNHTCQKSKSEKENPLIAL